MGKGRKRAVSTWVGDYGVMAVSTEHCGGTGAVQRVGGNEILGVGVSTECLRADRNTWTDFLQF